MGARVTDLEKQYGAQVGLWAVDTGTGARLAHRADERFPLLSTLETLAAAALLRAHPLNTGYFDRVLHFSEADIVANSPVTSSRVADGMTTAEFAEAVITRSDNTAGNPCSTNSVAPQALRPSYAPWASR